jgi:hypothetical protein
MKRSLKKKRTIELGSRGWKVGDISDFLGLDNAEMALVNMKIALAEAIVRKRKSIGITQVSIAKKIKSSQSRVAKIESADPTV